jgi:hypothetical protein
VFCLDALDDAPTRFSRPMIFDTDQGSQFTSALLHRPTGQRHHVNLTSRPG